MSRTFQIAPALTLNAGSTTVPLLKVVTVPSGGGTQAVVIKSTSAASSATSNRFAIGTVGVEAGASSGSNFGLFAYDDSGAFLSAPISVTRSTGAMTLNATLSVVSITCSNPAGLTISSTAVNTAVSIAAGGFIGATPLALSGLNISFSQGSAGRNYVCTNNNGATATITLPKASSVIGAEMFFTVGAAAPLPANDILVQTDPTDGTIYYGTKTIGVAAPVAIALPMEYLRFVGGKCAPGDYFRLKFINSSYIHVEAVSSIVGGITVL